MVNQEEENSTVSRDSPPVLAGNPPALTVESIKEDPLSHVVATPVGLVCRHCKNWFGSLNAPTPRQFKIHFKDKHELTLDGAIPGLTAIALSKAMKQSRSEPVGKFVTSLEDARHINLFQCSDCKLYWNRKRQYDKHDCTVTNTTVPRTFIRPHSIGLEFGGDTRYCPEYLFQGMLSGNLDNFNQTQSPYILNKKMPKVYQLTKDDIAETIFLLGFC